MSNSDKGKPKYQSVAALSKGVDDVDFTTPWTPVSKSRSVGASGSAIEKLSVGGLNLQLSMLRVLTEIKYSEIFKKHC
jgi:hypothetical protein